MCPSCFTVALRDLTIWGAHWTTAGYPEPIVSTKDSYTCYGISGEWVEARHLKTAAATVFKIGAASLMVTPSSLLFILETNVISSLSGRLSSITRYLELGGKYHSICTHTLYFLLSPRDLKKLRVIKEYFMRKVMLGFIVSNSNITFAITDIVIWFFKFAVMYFTEF